MDKNIKQVLEDTELSNKAKRVYQDMHKLYGYKKTFVTISDLVKMIHENTKLRARQNKSLYSLKTFIKNKRRVV